MNIKILDNSKLVDKLELLKEQGFNQIKLPGGTSKDRKHYSGVIIFHYDSETKKTYFLGLPYNSDFHKKELDSGFDKKVEGETPEQTAIREVMEETGLILELKDLKELLPARKEITVKKEELTTVVHTKHFFLADSFSGTSFEFIGENPIDGETAAPLWMPADLFKKELWIGHQKALTEASKVLSEDKDVCLSIMFLLH